jgi:hypothetical protein
MNSRTTSGWVRRLVQTWLSRPLLRKAKSHYRLQVEALEARVVPTTWTVNNTNASGAGSLAAAVQSANSDTSPSLINFDPAVFSAPQTITLTASLVLSNATEPVTIDGPTAVTVTISGNSQYQDFVINNSAVAATIQNLTISNGNGGSNNGGGFSIGAGMVTIDHCTISNNSASNGAGIWLNGGTLLVENSTLAGNTAGSGGAIYNTGGVGMTVLDCLFSGNAANYDVGGGGAIYTGTTNPSSVIDSTFYGNTSYGGYYGGGGVATFNGNISLVGCTLTGNAANGGGSGGAIFNAYGNSTTYLTDDIIWNNSASSSSKDVASGFNGARQQLECQWHREHSQRRHKPRYPWPPCDQRRTNAILCSGRR